MTSYMFPNQRKPAMNFQKIAVRAIVTFFEAGLGVLLASGLTDLSPETGEAALAAAGAAGLSVVYNALRQFLETDA